MISTLKFSAIFSALFALTAWAHPTAELTMKDAKGKDVGTVRLMEMGKGVHVIFEGHDLPPGEHAFHFHEKGSCIAPDFKSAGGHFNPTGKEHGMKNPKGHHAGDMANFTVAADGKAHFDIMNDAITMKHKEKNSVWQPDGISAVIHAKADDETSQPAGNAGDRIACGELKDMSAKK